jgi:hypothetical protein
MMPRNLPARAESANPSGVASSQPSQPGNLTDLQLAGGWRLQHRLQASARHVIEIYDVSRDLVGLVASTRQPLVSIAGRSPGGRVRRTIVEPVVVDGLWVAMVSGRQATVSLRQGPHQRLHRVSPTIRGRP